MTRIDMVFGLLVAAALVFLAILVVPKPLPGDASASRGDRHPGDASGSTSSVVFGFTAPPVVPERKTVRRRRYGLRIGRRVRFGHLNK